ncbi:cupin domain-containing protein [Holophaga foetida]|uniref:cupin domain-containing protein n=1 Tax=Holophaga foetida TaxID=35839 RepID=UPI00024750CC|nr:cupin domain-containing protein [Holophaga foetida]
MSTITNLELEMPISKDATTSRPLMDLPGSTKLVLFAMDQGQEISAHSAPFPAHVLLLAGSIEVMVEGALQVLAPGMQCALPKGLPHGIKALGPSHWMLTMLRGL